MKKELISNGRMWKNEMEQDNVFVENAIVKVSDFYTRDANGHYHSIKPRKGMEHAVISNGTLVNVVSDNYGHLPNEMFFLKMEEKLEDKNIRYVTRSINREDGSFAVDYILQDEDFHINVKQKNAQGKDVIKPMMRLINSYNGKERTRGYFGLYRETCKNTAHVAETNIGFSMKHRGNIVEIVMPEIDKLLVNFLENEFYSLHRKFEVLAERPILDIENFVRMTATDLKVFKFEASDKNPLPSSTAKLVIDIMKNEASLLGVEPNYWLGYNAFNEVVGKKLQKTFENTRTLDKEIFSYVSNLAMVEN